MGKRQEPRGWGMKWLNNSDSKCSNLLNNNSQIQEFQPTRNKKSKGTHSLVHKSTPLKSHDKEKLYEQAGVGRHITDKWNIKWPQVSHKKQCKPKDKRKISVKCEKKKKKKTTQNSISYENILHMKWSKMKTSSDSKIWETSLQAELHFKKCSKFSRRKENNNGWKLRQKGQRLSER